MRLKFSDFVRFIASTFSLAIGVFFCFSAASASAQATKSTRPEPRLPGAIEKAPDWLKDAPFDVVKFFETPPASENAAALYLEAFFEFGTQLKEIFPPDVLERSDEIADRARRADEIFFAWEKDPASVDRASTDAILGEFQDGFRKLDLAQLRPRCVFASSLDHDSGLSYLIVARCVTRAWLLRVSRSLDREDFDAAIGDLGKMLRLSRDLRPRGVPDRQILSIAIDSSTSRDGIGTVLAHPKLEVEHCDRLLALLDQHEAQAIDPFLEAIRAEFVATRSLLRIFSERIKTTSDADGRPVDIQLDQQGVIRELNGVIRTMMIREFVEGIAKADDTAREIQAFVDLFKRPGNPVPDEQVREILDKLAKLAEKEVEPTIERTRSLLAAKPGYRERLGVLNAWDAKNRDARRSKFFERIATAPSPFLEGCERDRLYISAAKCLVALRRWQLTHATTSTDLAEVCRASKLPGVPIDPFSGSPLKLAMIEGEPVIYSVGPDSVDDKGLKDSKMGRNPEGDLLFPLPKRK